MTPRDISQIEIPQCETGAARSDLDMLPGCNPAAVANALVTPLLAHVIVHNAHDAGDDGRHSHARSIRTTPT